MRARPRASSVRNDPRVDEAATRHAPAIILVHKNPSPQPTWLRQIWSATLRRCGCPESFLRERARHSAGKRI